MKFNNVLKLFLVLVSISNFSFAKRFITLVNNTEFETLWNVHSTQIGCCSGAGCDQALKAGESIKFDLWRDNERGALCLAPCIDKITVTIQDPNGPAKITLDKEKEVVEALGGYITGYAEKAAAAGKWISEQFGSDTKVDVAPYIPGSGKIERESAAAIERGQAPNLIELEDIEEKQSAQSVAKKQQEQKKQEQEKIDVPLETVARLGGYVVGGVVGTGLGIGDAIRKQCFMDKVVLNKVELDGNAHTYDLVVT